MLGATYSGILRTIDKPITADCVRLVAREMWNGDSAPLIARKCDLNESTVYKWFSGDGQLSKEGVKNFVGGLSDYTLRAHQELSGTTTFTLRVAQLENNPESSTRPIEG